jgi:ferrochelatase
MKEALLLVNMGGPANLDDVQPYLRAIFRDPAILPLPRIVREPLAWFISLRRAGKVAQRYKAIGGKSPLLHWTRRLAEETSSAAKKMGRKMPIVWAFRYCTPTIEMTLVNLKEDGVGRVVLVPLFPHYTKAMTGSILTEADRIAEPLGMTIREVRSWWEQADILSLWEDYLKESLIQAGSPAAVLFVAHGIPQSAVERGEDYPDQVRNHARRLASILPEGMPWSVAFQSRVGWVKWTEPYLNVEIDRLGNSGRTLVIMPLSFAADCLETLYDLDIEAAERARQAGFNQIVRVRVFNDDPRFAQALLNIALETAHVA